MLRYSPAMGIYQIAVWLLKLVHVFHVNCAYRAPGRPDPLPLKTRSSRRN